MGNLFQKIIYNLSSVSPILLMTAIVWVLQIGTFVIPRAILVVFCIINVIFITSFCYAKRHLASIEIRASSVTPHDGWVMSYMATYILPFATYVLKDIDSLVLGGIVAAMVFVSGFVINTPPNPILFLMKYHFYKVSVETGMGDYLLISKRKIRNKNRINNVYRVFELFLLEVEG